MNLTSLPFPVYGDASYRGKCQDESFEQMSFFNRLRQEYPEIYGAVAVHVRNERLLEGNQFSAVIRQKAEGAVTGASDIFIPGNPSFTCEMKRKNHMLSKWQPKQVEYLTAVVAVGGFACVALGAEAAWDAFEEWRASVRRP